MNWISTRSNSPAIGFIDALFAGTAPDGGLYMPERLDPLPPETVDRLQGADIVEIGTTIGSHILRDEITREALQPLIREALDFPVPLVPVTERVSVLELFHGPTLAFKDVGARVQARLLHHFTDGTPLMILVATSGDTGSAVAQAFHRVPDSRVVVLYPEGQVSDVQEAQMASLGDNITALAVRGTFDDCQRLVKQAFADDSLRAHVWLTPANSINLGRLLPQVFYYFVLAGLAAVSNRLIVSVPSGNFGNLTAGLIAKRIGLRVAQFVAATNVNDAVPEYLKTGLYQPRPSIATVANAMDVGAPSNFERVQALYNSDLAALRHDVVGYAYDDTRVIDEIRRVHQAHGYVLDPHSAIAWLALQDRLADEPDARGVFLATAHPAKFREVVEPAIGRRVGLPRPLADALSRPRHSVSMPADYAALEKFLRATPTTSSELPIRTA
ncbi:MAG TPA: threonine synthase [Vicinamibacterales bacterium]|jgi:threonine synthase|nr:threonine synthase [Vicinamibacterales bacterium]